MTMERTKLADDDDNYNDNDERLRHIVMMMIMKLKWIMEWPQLTMRKLSFPFYSAAYLVSYH